MAGENYIQQTHLKQDRHEKNAGTEKMPEPELLETWLRA